MSSEVIKLNLIPKGEMPVFHASQFDTGRLITCELYRGEDAYSVPEGYTVELHCRKVDNNIVTMASTLINDNVVTFTSTEQLTACNGKNLCEVAILDEGYRIGTLNFILEVEIDPLKGGIASTSEIHNLETQVEEITTEIIGENYYNKTEVDDLLDTKADASSVYTKSQTDTLLNAKADSDYVNTQLNILDDSIDDLADVVAGKANSSDVYTKAQVDTALALKANAADVYTKEQTYTKTQVDALIDSIFPTLTASGAIASFTTALTKPLVSVTAAEGATTITRCGVNLLNPSLFDNDTSYYEVQSDGSIKVLQSDNRGWRSLPNTLFLKAGTYMFVRGSVSGYCDVRASYDNYLSNIAHVTGKTLGFTLDEDCYIKVKLDTSSTYPLTETVGINYPSTDTTYTPYNGQTVSVSDASTLVTQSGINNVFADVGDVTVQYKYMSI